VGLQKLVFSSDQLPPGLAEEQRFKAWSDLYHGQFGIEGDFKASGVPFKADMVVSGVGDIVIVRARATVASSEHGGHSRATAEDEGRMGFLVNTSGHPIRSDHRGREEVVQTGGAMLLSRADLGRFLPRGDHISWVIVDMPRVAVTRASPKAEDLVGSVLSGGGEARRMAMSYIGLVLQESFADRRLDSHVSQTLLDLFALALGAETDVAELARERGLRAARLDAVLKTIAEGYAEASFSIAVVAGKLGLSERYIQDLLHSTGTGFGERVLELRLQHSVGLLARAEANRSKVSDIAYACGFSDLSYFHRCFRRRFGMTPAGARAAG
jgi:AraC-like DNA-binding protein